MDDDKNDGNRYFYLDDGNYKSVSSRYVGERTSITVNGVVAAQNAGRKVFAQKVANELGQNTIVYAPETFLNVYNNGEVDISYDVPVIENGEVFYENPGNWNEFHGR